MDFFVHFLYIMKRSVTTSLDEIIANAKKKCLWGG